MGETGAPLIIELLFIYFSKHPEGLRSEGLFRKSVGIEEETWLL